MEKYSLCLMFKTLAFNTWEAIKESKKVNFQLKEETITDINILNVKRIHYKSQIKTKVFKKCEESKNGADWEWWFRGMTGNWIGFRVQAKIINITSDKFEHLHYKKGSQCDKLIQNALTIAPYKIPIYCFYLQTDDNSCLTIWNQQTVSYSKELYGCSLTSAFNVRNLYSTKKRHLKDLQKDLKPWHCLVCYEEDTKIDFISNIHSYAKQNFKFDFDVAKELDIKIPEDFITQKPPNYVLEIFENENNNEIKITDEELGGVMIISEVNNL